MADKDKLASMLGGEKPKPQIRRGQGVRLSTEDQAAGAETQERASAASQSSEIAGAQKRTIAGTQSSEVAQTQKRTIAGTQSEPKRVNRGYMLREDLIKECKMIAVREDRNLYEVMEEALEEYLARRKTG